MAITADGIYVIQSSDCNGLQCIRQHLRGDALCLFEPFPGDQFSRLMKKNKKTSPNNNRDCCINGVMSLYPSFYRLCVSRHSETSSLAFISSQQPIIESHSLKRSKYILKKKFQSLFIFFQGKFSCCRRAASDCFFPQMT